MAHAATVLPSEVRSHLDSVYTFGSLLSKWYKKNPKQEITHPAQPKSVNGLVHVHLYSLWWDSQLWSSKTEHAARTTVQQKS